MIWSRQLAQGVVSERRAPAQRIDPRDPVAARIEHLGPNVSQGIDHRGGVAAPVVLIGRQVAEPVLPRKRKALVVTSDDVLVAEGIIIK